MFIVVGLGNPGAKYTGTRHNLGFRVADRLADDRSTRIRRSQFRALTATVRIGRSEVLLMKPQTYMNASGKSVEDACRALSVPYDRVIVVCDDADLALARIRVRQGGGTGGHRGLDSIIGETGSRDFVRVRLGVGRPPAGIELDEHVLAPVAADEKKAVTEMMERGADAVAEIVINGVAPAMQKFNGPPPQT